MLFMILIIIVLQDMADIEAKVNCGEAEELIEQAESELELLYAMNG